MLPFYNYVAAYFFEETIFCTIDMTDTDMIISFLQLVNFDFFSLSFPEFMVGVFYLTDSIFYIYDIFIF